MKFNEKVLANAAAVWIGAVYLLCGLAVALFPNFTHAAARSWFHGIDIAKIWSAEPFPGNFLLGFVTAVTLTWLYVYLFAWLYNYFLGKK